MPYDVIGVGLACYDHLVMVPSFDEVSTGTRVARAFVQGGGVAATACVASARLGASTALYTRVAEDFFGRIIYEELSDFGVALPLGPVGNAASPVSTVLVEEKTGERRFLYCPGKGLEEAVIPPPEDEMAAAGALLVDGRWKDASLQAVRSAVGKGVPVVTDIGHMRPHEMEILRLADYIIFSKVILGRQGEDKDVRRKFADKILREGRARLVGFTLGEDGCEVYFSESEQQTIPAFVVDVVDTTGAGDAFHGGFTYAISQGWNAKEALELGQAVGAMACRGFGGRASLPTLEEARIFLSEHGR